MMAYLGDTTTAHNAAPPPRSTTTTPARVTYPCSHRQCQLGVQGVGAEQRNPLTLPSYQVATNSLNYHLEETEACLEASRAHMAVAPQWCQSASHRSAHSMAPQVQKNTGMPPHRQITGGECQSIRVRYSRRKPIMQ